MQERRITIRLEHPARAHYCPADDLLPRDGRLENLSERGAKVWVHEAHRRGERITITFPLQGTDSLVTATGTVHWSSKRLLGRPRHAVGLEWRSMDERARQRLQEFLGGDRWPGAPAKRRRRAGVIVLALGAAVVGLGVSARWTAGLMDHNRRLGGAVEQRNMVIGTLSQREEVLRAELDMAKGQLDATSREIAQLDGQARELETLLGSLTQDVGRVQRSYAQAQQERRALAEQLVALERNRAELIRRLTLAEELRLAVREAIESRQALRQAPATALRAPPPWPGNFGFVIRDGRSTIPPSTAADPPS